MAILRRARWRAVASALIVAFAVAGSPTGAAPGAILGIAEAAPVDVHQVKAAFLFNFAKFVTWPQASLEAKELTICVLGEDSFAETLEQVIGGRSVGDRAVVVRRSASVDETDACQIVFVPSDERSRGAAVIERLARKPVLTVGESDGFAARGAIINFRVEESRVRFEVNPDAAKRAGLELSSQLLKLAILVRE